MMFAELIPCDNKACAIICDAFMLDTKVILSSPS